MNKVLWWIKRSEANLRIAALAVGLAAQPALAQITNEWQFEVEGYFRGIACQPDGRLIVAGEFSKIQGQPCAPIVRLLPNGTLDPTFQSAINYSVRSIALQPDGKVLVTAGLASAEHPSLCRLNPDGSLDTVFNSTNPTCIVNGVQFLPDGKLLVSGSTMGRYLWRLNSDLTEDTSFQPQLNGNLNTCVLQTDGKILVSCVTSNNGLQRLNSDGSVDAAYHPVKTQNPMVLMTYPDGKALITGVMSSELGTTAYRLNADGTWDAGFSPQISDLESLSVNNLILQSDGKILLGGMLANGMLRLDSTGVRDPAFVPPVVEDYWRVSLLTMQSSGKLLVARYYNGKPQSRLECLSNPIPATQSLRCTGGVVTWQRSGSGPEVTFTRLAVSTNGLDWVDAGPGEKITGGWQWSGQTWGSNCSYRAIGAVCQSVSRFPSVGGSSWFVESVIGPPAIITPPASLTNHAGSISRFHLVANGTEPVFYQWFKNGVALETGARVSGAHSDTLELYPVDGGDAGTYSVIVSNALGVVSASATLTVIDPFISTQPASQKLNLGDFAQLQVEASGQAPLAYQWRKNGETLVGSTNSFLVFNSITLAEAGNYDVVVQSAFGVVTSSVARVAVNLSTVDTFTTAISNTPYITPCFALAEQANGQLWLGGIFGAVNGQTRSNLARLNPDGTLDLASPTDTGGTDYPGVYAVAVQPDGKVLVGGGFSNISGQPRTALARLYANGQLDPDFLVNIAGANDPSVTSLALQPDGKILIAGIFTHANGVERFHLARLEPDGTLDADFNPGETNSGMVYAMAIQPDGKILIGGWGQGNLIRLLSDGSRDATFNPAPNNYVNALLVQPDGKILAAGNFTSMNGQPCASPCRLNPDGSLDLSFSATTGCGPAMVLQADGKILVSPQTGILQTTNDILRLNPDGTEDNTFYMQANDFVSALALQSDGHLLVAGAFTQLNGQRHERIGRLNNPDPADQSLNYQDTTITWMRSGSCPEVWRTTFEYSNDGTNWMELGAGIRIPGGWQCPNAAPNGSVLLRARGYTSGGFNNTCHWFVESRLARMAAFTPNFYRLSMSETNHHFGFSINGPAGITTVIETTTDFIHWDRIWTNPASTLPVPFFDKVRPFETQRFYRVIPAP